MRPNGTHRHRAGSAWLEPMIMRPRQAALAPGIIPVVVAALVTLLAGAWNDEENRQRPPW